MGGASGLTARVKCINKDCKHYGTLKSVDVPTRNGVVLRPREFMCGNCTEDMQVVLPVWMRG